nr:retrovirus-related Pol polyprotein from transposon TNT 1-94 [Tanacetum cinerariifolium]
MAAATDLDEIEEVNANYILMANLQQASSSGTQTDSAPIYDTDGSAEVHENYDDKEIFNLFTQEEQYTELLEPILEPQQVPQNDNNVISEATNVEQEKKRLKSDFKTCKNELLDKQIQLEKKIKELNNIVLKTGQSIQTIHMLSPKPNSFYHTEQKMALGYQNPFYLKQAQKKQQSLYDGKVLLTKHDPIVVHDSKETLQLAKESREKMKQMNKEIKPANYTKINHLSGVFVLQTALSREELYFSNISKTDDVSKSISIPNEDLSDDTTPSVARKFLNELTRLQNFKIQFLKEAAKFVGDFKSLAKEADASLAKHKILEMDIEHLQTELEHTKERFENCIIKKENEYAKFWNDWKHKANVSKNETQQKNQPEIKKPKKVGFRKSLATPKPRKPRFLLRWSPTGKMLNQDGKLVAPSNSESHVDCSNGCSKHMTGNLKLLVNFVWKFLGTVRFGNDHVDAILGFGDLQWGNILITRVYFVEGLGHNLFSVGQFCDSDLEVSFRRNACFVRNLEGVDLLKGDHLTNLYTINLHEMASASPICLMAQASSTKSWLWHQRSSHLNFDTINELARNDLVAGLLKFKYNKEHLCPSCEQGKSKRASHPPKPVPNSRQRLHLLHMDLCGPMRIASINRKHTTTAISNLNEMASASPICLMARASSTKSGLWHQRLSHLNFDTINDLVSGLPKFKYHKEHLCPSCEQEKSKRASHPPKPVPNSRQRLHLLYMDLCGAMRIASINGKRYVLVIVDDYSRYTLVHFLRSKDEAPEVIITFLKRITVLLQSLVIIIRTDNGT